MKEHGEEEYGKKEGTEESNQEGNEEKTCKEKEEEWGGRRTLSDSPRVILSAATPRSSLPESRRALYASSSEGLKAVRDDFLYWTGKLTDSSFELSVGVIGANWAVFGSVQKILSNRWSKGSVALVIATLALSLVGARLMGELHRRRIELANDNPQGWEEECAAALGGSSPWPFTRSIERTGRILREIKTWLPLLAGTSFLIALLTH